MAGTIKLTSKDGKIFDAEMEVACLFQLVNNMVEDGATMSPFAVTGSVLNKMLEFTRHYLMAKANGASGDDEMKIWKDKFYEPMDRDQLYDILKGASYMEHKVLVDATAQAVADRITRLKTPEKIRKEFNIKDDFTPEDEEKMKQCFAERI